MASETSAGQKPSDSSSLSAPSPLSPLWAAYSQPMGTTLASLKDGGKEGAATEKSIPFSDECMSSSAMYPGVSQSTLLTSLVNRTQQMDHQEVFTPPPSFYSLQSTFPL